ncbi:hypothetical protein K8R20_00720 [bacterium]|nr:hypothetical protein [bacterium]
MLALQEKQLLNEKTQNAEFIQQIVERIEEEYPFRGSQSWYEEVLDEEMINDKYYHFDIDKCNLVYGGMVYTMFETVDEERHFIKRFVFDRNGELLESSHLIEAYGYNVVYNRKISLVGVLESRIYT